MLLLFTKSNGSQCHLHQRPDFILPGGCASIEFHEIRRSTLVLHARQMRAVSSISYVLCSKSKSDIIGHIATQINIGQNCIFMGNLYLNWRTLFHTFSHNLTSFFLRKCIHSIISHQYMYKICIWMHNITVSAANNPYMKCSMCRR